MQKVIESRELNSQYNDRNRHINEFDNLGLSDQHNDYSDVFVQQQIQIPKNNSKTNEVPPRSCTPEGYLLKVEDDVNELLSPISEPLTLEAEPLPDEYRKTISLFEKLRHMPVLECEESTHGYLLDALDYWEQGPQILFGNRREGWEIKSQFYFVIGKMKFEVWQESVLHISDE